MCVCVCVCNCICMYMYIPICNIFTNTFQISTSYGTQIFSLKPKYSSLLDTLPSTLSFSRKLKFYMISGFLSTLNFRIQHKLAVCRSDCGRLLKQLILYY